MKEARNSPWILSATSVLSICFIQHTRIKTEWDIQASVAPYISRDMSIWHKGCAANGYVWWNIQHQALHNCNYRAPFESIETYVCIRKKGPMFIYNNQLNARRNIYITVQTSLRHVSTLMCHLQGVYVPSLRLVTVGRI